MKIVAGMGCLDDYIDFAEAGADEVFIGYVPERWQLAYGPASPLNRREVCYYNVQIGSHSELEILSNLVSRYKVPVTIAFNGLNFRPDQYPVIGGIMLECLELGFDSVIIADFGLLVYLSHAGLARKLKIHLSGESGEINFYILKEAIRLGISRLIFHRKVSLDSMKKIIESSRKMYEESETYGEPETYGKPETYVKSETDDMDNSREENDSRACKINKIEFEAFIMNENCHFNGAYCNSLHCDELVPMCRMPYKLSGKIEEKGGLTEKNGPATDSLPEKTGLAIDGLPEPPGPATDSLPEKPGLAIDGLPEPPSPATDGLPEKTGFEIETGAEEIEDSDEEYFYDYGLASVPALEEMGVSHLKIVGRGASSDDMIKSIRKVRTVILA